ncbi:putative hexaprenyl pyrophosphate synthase [Venturia nashicola]|uniref:Putative hexaprenyl pyrophosphate synthase n=1 Tax=Venturia nashicola TaxID=86259 RepID=A0A4Z1PJE5_9PEZI|nr:putative hexaprenyl pyrophosphate synthase [Venturia nashicola]TLD35286.1 putative hexaprenyl pyrophosphate synthase [Venturia nashicola]
MANPTVLITGSSGCLGGAVIQCLRDRLPDASLFALDISTPTTDKSTPGVEYLQADICDTSAIPKILSRIQPQVIIHTAGLVPSAAWRLGVGDAGLRAVNTEGTQNLLDAARAAGSVVAFVYTSSCVVVKGDNWMDLEYVNESITPPQKFDELYAETKAIAEHKVLSSASSGFKTAAIRPCGIIGPNDNTLVPVMAVTPRRISIGRGTNLYDFTSAENAALAHVLAVENLLSPSKEGSLSANGKAFFVTDQRPMPMRRLMEMIWECLDHGQVQTNSEEIQGNPVVVPIVFVYALVWIVSLVANAFGKVPMFTAADLGAGVSARYFDNSLARDVLGYVPRARLEDSIRDACKSYKTRQGELRTS